MRPVRRPRGRWKNYPSYHDALDDLERAFGLYCSYCERHLKTGLAVEHIAPKSKAKKMKTAWRNFLLACSNCNSVKGIKSTKVKQCLWPDRDNTFRAFTYVNGLAELTPGLSHKAASKADKLMKLVGLHRHPGMASRKDRPARRDKRAEQREKVWALAGLKKADLVHNDNDAFRTAIVDLAKAEGFFSVWMAVFGNDQDMRKRLLSAFAGTATVCFDAKGNPLRRGRV